MGKLPITYNENTLFVSYYEAKHDRQNILAKQFNSQANPAAPFGGQDFSQIFSQLFTPTNMMSM